LPQLALVAEEEGKIVGHIMLTKTYVTSTEKRFEAWILAPLSVALEFRSRGIGSKFVHESFELAKNMGFKAVFVVGDPRITADSGLCPRCSSALCMFPRFPLNTLWLTSWLLGL
jgi:predicted N-acetyltransferase YhbS